MTAAPDRNRLAGETSPYLLQHAGNPVDWYPWGDEAFARAREEQKPVLLSVGYSSCHWCHVMAHESFEDPEIAALMNEHFVNVKVDREERPDVDSVYMTATQALTGQGGWPMTVFVTPAGEPFYAGTYFPPTDAHGRPGFRTLLEAVARSWETERERLLESAANITSRLREASDRRAAQRGALDPALPTRAVARLDEAFDATWGGFGGAPKFPTPSNLEFLLAHHGRTGNAAAREIVLHTLRRMTEGGMYDQLGGGFSRYSVDARWLVPHFEKMLYDNAQLVRTYLHGYQLATDPEDRARFEDTVRASLTYMERELLDPAGGFYSAQDADSEGIEGKYFVWTPAEISEVLGLEDGAAFNAFYAVSEDGNFRDPHHPEFTGRSVLSTPRPLAAVAAELGTSAAELAARLKPARARLLEARERRVRPGLDDKVLTSWNGLAIAAFAEAGRVLGEPRYIEVARRCAEFLGASVWRDGALLHTYKQGVARVDGLLEDYAFLGLGLIELYRATGDLASLHRATELFEVLLARFQDRDAGGFFDTPEDGEALILRQKSTFDGATPSGNGAAALLAFWLARYLDRPSWEGIAEAIAASLAEQLAEVPSGFGATLQAVELLLAPRREVAIVGTAEARAPLEAEVARRYLPSVVLASAGAAGGLPLLEDRAVLEGAAAFVCEQMVCQLPVTTVEALRAQLDAL